VHPGSIHRHAQCYADAANGTLLPKFMLILAAPVGDDLVFRVLTSKPRPEVPACHHGAPYPSYFLGVVGGLLSQKTWVDLRRQPDFDIDIFASGVRKQVITPAGKLPNSVLAEVLACAAVSDDVTDAQARKMRDVLAGLR
jgi:hypothetical protein